jgi:hypothetical protein
LKRGSTINRSSEDDEYEKNLNAFEEMGKRQQQQDEFKATYLSKMRIH